MPDSNITLTPNLALARLPENYRVWAQIMNNNLTLLDAAVSGIVIYENFRGAWTNSTVYAAGDTAVDLETALVWQAQVAHTSAQIPTTFIQDRTAHSAYWTVFNSAGTGRGEWVGPGVAYTINDFVVHVTKYAICTASHVSTASFDDDAAAGKWHILLDLNAAPPNGPAAGDLDGTYPNPTIRNSVALTGAPTADTAPKSTSNNQVATTAFVQSQLESPVLTGNPQAPTPPRGDDDTSIATTEFVTRAISDIGPPPALDPDAANWWNSVLANGGVVSTAQINATNDLIYALRSAGAYALMDDIWLLASENQTQTLVSLKQRRLGVIVGTPTFSKKGVRFNGSSYIRTGFIPGTHAVSMTGSNMQIGIYLPQTSGASLTSFGTNQGVNQDLYAWPRSGGGQYFYGLNCPAANGGALADSVGLTTCYRNGTTFGGRKNGIDGPLYVPSSNAAVLPTFECYIGARNNSGVADQFCTFTVGLVFCGADLTAAREPAVYAAIQAYMVAIGALDIYVSSTGLDTNIGTQASPLLTFSAAYTAAQAEATIWLDGATATPVTYTFAANLITKALTVRAVNRRGAALTSTGTTQSALAINPANGETINLIGLIIDPSLNVTSPRNYSLLLITQPVLYTVNLTDCQISGWTGAVSGGIHYSTVSLRANVTVTGCDITTTSSTNRAINLISMAAGNLTVRDSTITLPNNVTTAGTGINLLAAGPSMTLTVDNTTIDITVDAAVVSGTRSAVLCTNAVGRLTNVRAYLRGTVTPVSGYVLQINVDGSGTASEFPIDGSLIDNCYVYSEMSGGGHLFGIGIEGGPNVPASRAKQNNCVISNCTGRVGGTCAPHGAFLGAVNNGKIINCDIEHPGLIIVNKNSVNSEIYGNTLKGGNALYCKGATGGSVHDNTVIQDPSTPAISYCFSLGADGGGTETPTTGVTYTKNVCVNNGQTSIQWATVDPVSSGSFTYNSYQHNTGSMYAPGPFFYQTVRYATFAAWKAAQEPTAAANFP